MAATAAVVVAASRLAERAGPLIGGMIATLPISAGPAYIFLALGHDDAFLKGSAVASVATNDATALLVLTYAALAPRAPLAVALGAAFVVWFAGAWLVTVWHPSFAEAVALSCVVLPLAALAARPLAKAVALPPAVARWWDVPFRAGLCGVLVATVVTLSARLGPALSGIAAVFPIVLSSLILILHPRIGGNAASAVMANCLVGIIGFGLAMAAVHLAAVPLGGAVAVFLLFAVSAAWNAALTLHSVARSRTVKSPPPPP
ncbi:hypothetical protein [Blastochloris viridis]|nr:hypothetical protein [Blastochloris viridis]